MKVLIIRTVFMYFLTVLWMLINLFCNPYLKIGRVDIESGEFEVAPKWFKFIFSLFWIFTIPIYFKTKKNVS